MSIEDREGGPHRSNTSMVTTTATVGPDDSPLVGIKVVEAGRFAAGPSCGTVLADWGASVVKLEPPGGDPARGPGSIGGRNPRFELHNRSRRSLALDLKKPEGRFVANRLIEQSDVFITNMRPKALLRLGLDYESLSEINDRLIYGQITGYGLNSEKTNERSYDHGAFWSYSGIAASFGDNRCEPPQALGGMGDRSSGAMLAGAVAAALFGRERTGKGCRVSTSLLATGIWMLGSDVSDALYDPSHRRTMDRRTSAYPTLNCFQAGDGRWFWLQMMTPEKHWVSLLDALGADWLDDDPRFVGGDQSRLAASGTALIEALDEIFRQRPLDEWETRLTRAGVPFAPVRSVAELVDDPVAAGSGAFIDTIADDGSQTRVVASPNQFNVQRDPRARPAPVTGQDTWQILRELAFSAEEIDAMRDAGIAHGVDT